MRNNNLKNKIPVIIGGIVLTVAQFLIGSQSNNNDDDNSNYYTNCFTSLFLMALIARTVNKYTRLNSHQVINNQPVIGDPQPQPVIGNPQPQPLIEGHLDINRLTNSIQGG